MPSMDQYGFQPSETSTPEKKGSTAMSLNASRPLFSWQSSRVSSPVQATWNQ